MGKTEVPIIDLVTVNPCSFASFEIVLDSFFENAMMNEKCEVVMAFLFYWLKIIDNCFTCQTCEELFRKKDAFVTL